MPDVAEWDTFPFAGVLDVRPLEAPLEAEPPRRGAGGVDCRGCTRPDSDYLWTDAEWRVATTPGPTGMPVTLFVEPREHYGEPGDLPDELAASMGRMLARAERAVRGIGEIGRVHVCRWGDGSEHLHWWVIARPARLPQVRRQPLRAVGRGAAADAGGHLARQRAAGPRRAAGGLAAIWAIATGAVVGPGEPAAGSTVTPIWSPARTSAICSGVTSAISPTARGAVPGRITQTS